jgi:hypothetical protein
MRIIHALDARNDGAGRRQYEHTTFQVQDVSKFHDFLKA